jgi:hypothetical protein
MPLRLMLAVAAVTGLSACAATVEPPADPAADSCRREPGQRFVGQRATAELGAEMLRATGAREIRWVPPDTAVTMDYKFGRLTVGYDPSMIVTSVSCG